MLTYRLHKLKHLPLLDLLHLEDILQGDLVEMLPNQVDLAVCLQEKKEEPLRYYCLGAIGLGTRGQLGPTGMCLCRTSFASEPSAELDRWHSFSSS